MVVVFNIALDPKEEGFRHLNLLLYGHQNYVSVYVKEDWHVCLKHSKTLYTKGSTCWMLAAHHDSCWREDGVQAVIDANKDRISSIFSPWYHSIEMDREKLLKEFNYSCRTEAIPKNRWVHKQGVFFFE
ncbi:MAG: hypothetical protein PHF86_09485 [Candidatus Nanoarchaeia archaeon]|nr:hypothetical protein [Candidatus Nanoarchaeia archaeon]